MPPNQRRYRMTRRLNRMAETRQRIVQATFELHGTIGPSRTTISAIADRAAVQRHTVYAHFPDLDSLYEACTTHGMAAMGMPEPGPWHGITAARDRLRTGLTDLIAWYRANADMLTILLGDGDPGAAPPSSAEPDPFDRRMAALFAALAGPWPTSEADTTLTLHAVIRHAMTFETWRSLAAGGLTDDRIVELLVGIVSGVADGSLPARPSLAVRGVRPR